VRPLVLVYPFIVIAGFMLLLAVFHRMPMLNQLTALQWLPRSSHCALETIRCLPLCPIWSAAGVLTREVATGKATLSYASMLTFAVIYALLFSP